MLLPARSSSGGVKSTPAIRPLAIDGAAVMMTMNKMAGVLLPNRMIANGIQTTDGIVCRPVIIEPTAARTGGTRATTQAHQGPDDERQREPDDRAAQRGPDGLPELAVAELVPQVREDLARAGQDVVRLHLEHVDEFPHAEHDRDREHLGPQRAPDPAADLAGRAATGRDVFQVVEAGERGRLFHVSRHGASPPRSAGP